MRGGMSAVASSNPGPSPAVASPSIFQWWPTTLKILTRSMLALMERMLWKAITARAMNGTGILPPCVGRRMTPLRAGRRQPWHVNMSAIFRLFSSQQHANILPMFRPKVANTQHQYLGRAKSIFCQSLTQRRRHSDSSLDKVAQSVQWPGRRHRRAFLWGGLTR